MNINAECPRFNRFLKEIFEDDDEKINFVQQAIGYGFCKSIPTAAIFFFVGSGSNGKSVLLDTMSYLFGEQNTSCINLNNLSNEYYLLELFSKMINISSETPQDRIFNSHVIKAVVSGDWISARNPYNPPVKFKPFAKHYIAMNEIPSFNDFSYGMLRRLYIIKFERIFKKDEIDTSLLDKLQKELPGIFNWAFDGYKKLRENNFKFTVPDSMEALKNEYKESIDNVSAFESIYMNRNAESKIKFSNLYERYLRYCSIEGYIPLGKMKFKNRLVNVGYKVRPSDCNQVYLIGGELLNDDSLSSVF